MKSIYILSILAFVILVLGSCNSPKESTQQSVKKNDYTFKYDLKSPKSTALLSNELTEISYELILYHLTLFSAAWGVHLGRMLEYVGFLLASFTQERKH